MEATLALHTAVPRIEAAYQYYADSQAGRGADCGSWVDWYGEVVCDVESLRHLTELETIEAGDVVADNRCVLRLHASYNDFNRTLHSSTRSPKLLPFDHAHPSPDLALDRPPRTAILYTSFTSSNFRDLHAFLYSASNTQDPHLEYVLRHVPPADHASREERTYLSGYGVALDLKKMDYLALDDRRQGTCARSSCMRIHLH